LFNKLAVIEDLLEGRDVSRETINKLEIYYTLLKKWNSAYNLVENESLQKAINRHYLDSIQLYKLIDPNKSLVDVGAGAGFPGMVIAILGASKVHQVKDNLKALDVLPRVTDSVLLEIEGIFQNQPPSEKDWF
jgi:16S rRNA (guanine527-N7)-methyltransferase